MVARVATFNTLPGDVDPDAAAFLRQTVRDTPGFVAGYHLRRPGRKSISITIFEDADAGRAAAKALDQRPKDQRVGIDPDHVEFFEVEPC
jgi:hypothetical protein